MKKKSILRQETRTHLRGLPHSEIEDASQKIAHHLCQDSTSPAVTEGTGGAEQTQTIAIFSAHGPEIDLSALHLLLPQARLVYPLCHLGGLLTFHHVPDSTELRSGMRDILEPDPKKHEKISIPDIDLFLCPGLAFGRDHTRLGQGGGFYDRALEQKSSTSTTVGIGLQCQLFDSVPHDAHDIHLDYVLTERGFI